MLGDLLNLFESHCPTWYQQGLRVIKDELPGKIAGDLWKPGILHDVPGSSSLACEMEIGRPPPSQAFFGNFGCIKYAQYS